MRRGFSFFEVVTVVLAVVVAGLIAIPPVLVRDRERLEAAAVRSLRELAFAQHRHRHSDPAGRKGYAWFPELAADPGFPADEVGFDGPADADFTRIGAYYVALLLPDAAGRPVPWSRRAQVDPERASEAFLLLAWPVEAGRTGYRAYAVEADLRLWETKGAESRLTGPALPEAPVSRILLGRPPSTPLPEPWTLLLPGHLDGAMRDRLVAAGLPVPPSLTPTAP